MADTTASSLSSTASNDAAAASFGDVLAQLLRELPEEASSRFLMSLSGLDATESFELCDYVSKLRAEKQFRVIRAMAESTIEGKKKFLVNLRTKFERHQAHERQIKEQEAQNMQELMKRKQAMHAAARVKMLNPSANKFHSFNAAVGAGDAQVVATAKENQAATANSVNRIPSLSEVMKQSSFSNLPLLTPDTISRSLSSSSILLQGTKEDITNVGKMLGDTQIGESEQNLRALEISKKGFASPYTTAKEDQDQVMQEQSKRERPASSRDLLQNEEKQLVRRAREEEEEDDQKEKPEPVEDPEAPTTKRWTKLQDAALRESVRIHGEKNWKAIAELVPGRNHAQCLQRWRKVLKPGLVKGHWSFEEDQVLEYLVTQGCNNWGQIAERIPGRTPKQCRERWKNHLDPAINKGPYTEDEDKIILEAQARLGNKWSQIAQLLQGRTEDSVKIRWKSLKQNPAKATASYAQHKKLQAQQAVSTENTTLQRHRQLQLLQQQQRLQQNEAAQALEQQQLQQQQALQLRLQQKLHQQHQHPEQLPGSSDAIKQEPYATTTATSSSASTCSSSSSSHMASMPPMSMGMYSNEYGSYVASYEPYTTSALASNAPYTTLPASLLPSPSASSYHAHTHHTSPSSAYGEAALRSIPSLMHLHEEPSTHPHQQTMYNLHTDGGGMQPPPSSSSSSSLFWDPFLTTKLPHPEPIPLHDHSGGAVDDDVDADAMFETLATELGNNTIQFTPL